MIYVQGSSLHLSYMVDCGSLSNTVNREYFVVKIFSDSLACTKIKRTKIHAQY